MCPARRYIISSLIILLANHLPAQDLTGTWEGDLGRDQFLQLNIIQNGDKICGYTWDYVKADQRSTCKAYFEATYNKREDKWLFTGTSFFRNSGSHTLMKLSLKHRTRKGKHFLEGVSINDPIESFFFFRDETEPFILRKPKDDLVFLTKVSDKPSEILEQMKDCYQKKMRTFDTSKVKPPEKPADTIAKILPVVEKKADSLAIPKEFVKRKNKEQSHIEVNVKTITLNVYDNATVDGDTISVFYNGKLLLSHQRLSEKPVVIKLELDEMQARHEIILFAENLGSIPPNTALIVIYAGDKRYELYSSASLEENAVLVFDYRPK
jgi:hypothetical protein